MATQDTREPTRILAEFAAGLRYDNLPERNREHCKNLILDALACAVAGYQGEETGQVKAVASAIAQGGESSVIGGEHLSLIGATLFNGYLITAVTMCDVHRATMTHVTPEVVPPALAVAERDDLPGRDLLVAVAAGCEVTTRVGLGLDYPVFRARGWHGPGVIGPFGAAAAVGSLLKFDAEMMARAFGLAGSQAAGTFAAWGTPTVKFHQCRGAISGLLAALLAQQNFVATREFLSAADGGLYKTYAGGGKPEAAIAELKNRFELEQIALRLWPSATLIQGLNTALFDLLAKHQIAAARISRVSIALSQNAFDMHGGFREYKGKFEALLSAHYSAAAIVHDGALTLAQFAPARYDDQTLRAFATQKVNVQADPTLSGSQAKVELVLADDTTRFAHCEHPLGSFENPLSRAQVEQKFRDYAAGVLPQMQIEKTIEAVNGLETFGSVRGLMALLRAGPRSRAMTAAE
ncbi:MAG TPA: MmgE/PrpD family protein [Xanthobacteraceae bacterium]|jgi:2-methylcitrate dehydratase PrpD|nr:MmgE/PrpD family protein [Xanthobacteraceae bacterium]